ncbi:MAG: hypothetical protein JG776_470 [Caloramator sp.]|jgi:hypothetical protein|uniref:hypothetical protein n=1 Tax=Caloramator sp. TaxID=1871330 RepID=UPI001D7A5DA0|nr:hypothetical protein [Caloramator sp.]MBZ4662788.1 hypothetical protein [Caloramator sp.]
MCWNCPYVYWIDGQARCELDYRELSLADMANDECVVKGVKKDEQFIKKYAEKSNE